MKVFPVCTVLLTGTIRFGFSGVLLSVAGPVRTCTVPVEATCLKGKANVTGASAAATLEIFEDVDVNSTVGWSLLNIP